MNTHPETAHTMHGVPGRMFARHPKTPELWINQTWTSAARPVDGYGVPATMRVNARFDDSCKNGHNTFAITADVRTDDRRYKRDNGWLAGGCMHAEITERFPELAHLIPWHLTSDDGPMHYIADAVYLAGDRDHSGRRAGQMSAWAEAVSFGAVPIKHHLKDAFARFLQDATPHPGAGRFDFEVIRIDHSDRGRPGKYQFAPKHTFGGFGTAWHECPFDTELEALEFLDALQNHAPQFHRVATAWSEGKARELDAARRAAAWPEATDAELCQEPEALKAALAARLPDLLRRFRADIEGAGFLWQPAAAEVAQ